MTNGLIAFIIILILIYIGLVIGLLYYQYYSLTLNFAGVYILFNSTKNMYYVGQGKEVLNRVNAHFTGKGNGDVYADYKYGDKFTIKIISLEKSGYLSLNELERHTIMTYDSFASGYNKTRGNR